MLKKFNLEERDRIVEMARENKSPFEAIESQFGINESEVIELMKTILNPASFQLWKKSVISEKMPKTLRERIFGKLKM